MRLRVDVPLVGPLFEPVVSVVSLELLDIVVVPPIFVPLVRDVVISTMMLTREAVLVPLPTLHVGPAP